MYFKSICSFYFSNYWKGESKQLLWLYKKCLETGHVLKNLYWQPQNCLRPVSHVVKTTCSLLIKTHKKQLLTSIGSCTQLFQSSQVLSTAVLIQSSSAPAVQQLLWELPLQVSNIGLLLFSIGTQNSPQEVDNLLDQGGMCCFFQTNIQLRKVIIHQNIMN